MLKLLIYGALFVLLFREIYSVVLFDLYGEVSESKKRLLQKEQERAARYADRPHEFSYAGHHPSSCQNR